MRKKKIKNNRIENDFPVSKCCGDYAYVVGKTTHYYVCTKYEQSCDVVGNKHRRRG